MPQLYATLDDIAERYPRELLMLAADETTGERDDVRVERALLDATVEVRSILLARYDRGALDRLDEDALAVLKVHTIAIALYRVALAFSRSTERLKEGYEGAVKALQAIAAGKAALGQVGDDADGAAPAPGLSEADNGNVLFEANERLFTRRRMRGW